MALSVISALAFSTLLCTQLLGCPTQRGEVKSVPIRVTVQQQISSAVYHTSVLKGGVLYGALKRLQDNNNSFKFTATWNDNHGLFLESVNGVAGSESKKTYWEILSEKDNTVTRLDVGIGCYQPQEDEHIILKYSTYSQR